MAAPTNVKFPASQLVERSLQIILENQSATGAFMASPNFPTYAFCWFRDGSYIAYALDLYGKHDAAVRFHAWAASMINERVHIVERALQKAVAGGPFTDADVLHTRYTLDGKEHTSTFWENFQLDGFGTWLWALNEHHNRTSELLPSDVVHAARITADYIEGLWRVPCYDCWEEFGKEMHPHTLATIYGGLKSYAELTGDHRQQTLRDILTFLHEHAQPDGYWQKFIGNSQVDASLLSLSTPYRLVQPGDAVMRRTAEKIETDLCAGGVKRYATDTYYGGGQWILLAAWLAWYWWEIGEQEKARKLRHWIEAQADEHGWLPEQVAVDVNNESMIAPWVEKWGPSANPLLWSHAEYLILCKVMQDHN